MEKRKNVEEVKKIKAGRLQLKIVQKHALVCRQCLPWERMISEKIVVTARVVNVYVRLVQQMMELVTLLITRAIVCTNSVVHMVCIINKVFLRHINILRLYVYRI